MDEESNVTSDVLRAMFASALSDMYQKEVPQYGTLLDLVSEINHEMASRTCCQAQHRVEVERHGAIRLGKESELAMVRRLFALMGMYPVGYYDLTVAGLPVHATGFRPLTTSGLEYNPFRVFVSLLRVDLIQNEDLRRQAVALLSKREVFTRRCRDLIDQLETSRAMTSSIAEELVKEALITFRWHEVATVDVEIYKAMELAHPLVADIVCFKGPHINHLTPRVLDIDAAQAAMKQYGLQAKPLIEGPPNRKWPILLRQTSFLALEESITFLNGVKGEGKHRARFGEIEQRGLALTLKGQIMYNELFEKAQEELHTVPAEYKDERMPQILKKWFANFPDDIEIMRRESLAFFRYEISENTPISQEDSDLNSLVDRKILTYEPVVYEDFLPASAAGIFHSNLRESTSISSDRNSDQTSFEQALGCTVLDKFALYENIQQESITQCMRILGFS